MDSQKEKALVKVGWVGRVDLVDNKNPIPLIPTLETIEEILNPVQKLHNGLTRFQFLNEVSLF